MKKKALAAAIAAALSSSLMGCASFGRSEPTPAMQFNYSTLNGPAAGLVRAFVLNGSTVLQFIDISQAQPKVYVAGQATPAPYQVVGQYAILSGIHPALRVVANGATATVTATSLQAGEVKPTLSLPAAAPAAPADPLDAQLQEARQQLAQAKQRVDELQRERCVAGGNIRPAQLIVPVTDTSNTWTLEGGRTLKDNIDTLARAAGYAAPRWKASNPYMVTYTTKYDGTFVEVIGKIAEQVPALDFHVYSWKRTIEVVDAN